MLARAKSDSALDTSPLLVLLPAIQKLAKRNPKQARRKKRNSFQLKEKTNMISDVRTLPSPTCVIRLPTRTLAYPSSPSLACLADHRSISSPIMSGSIITNVGVRLFPTLIPNPTTQLENSFLERTKKIEKKRKVTHGLTRAPDVAAHLAAPLPFPALLSPLSQWKPTHTRHHHLQHHHSLTGTS